VSRSPRRWLALGAISLLALGCGAQLATPGGEARAGAAAAAEIEQAVGLVDAPALASYVDEIGTRLVASSAGVRGDLEYRFQLLDLADPNAFALPGGTIYITRGLLALLNGEDELANVIAHELAHVSERHHLKHALRQTPFVPVQLATGLAAGLLELAAWPLGRLGAPVRPFGTAVALLGSAPGALVLASHGRGQELEADALGQELAAAGGWDPAGMTRVIEALSRDALRRGGDPGEQSFLATHPSAPDRVATTGQRAAGLARADAPPFARDRTRFLAALDGLLVGESARGGVVDGSRFLHADLDITAAFPDGWTVLNGANTVSASPADAGDAAPLATLTVAGDGDDPEAVARSLLAQSPFEPDGELAHGTIGALRAVHVEGRDRSGRTAYHAVVTWIAHGGRVYQIIGAAPERVFELYRAELAGIAETFRPLEDRDRDRIVEARLRVIDSVRGETLAALLERHPGPWDLATAAAANALPDDVVFDAPRPVKLALWELYSPEQP
jgi:predicted Zn-dependent protease